jgi:hypothetical protein
MELADIAGKKGGISEKLNECRFTLKVKVACSFETVVLLCQNTWRHTKRKSSS